MTENATEITLPTVEEVVQSLTGFDEIAIKQRFLTDVENLTGIASMRALVFVLQRRDGKTDAEAWQHVMEMPLRRVQEQFDTSATDVMPEDTAAGNG